VTFTESSGLWPPPPPWVRITAVIHASTVVMVTGLGYVSRNIAPPSAAVDKTNSSRRGRVRISFGRLLMYTRTREYRRPRFSFFSSYSLSLHRRPYGRFNAYGFYNCR